MNYIKYLQEKTAYLEDLQVEYQDLISQLKEYLQSNKFTQNNQCNVNDILLRIEEKMQDVYEVKDQLKEIENK